MATELSCVVCVSSVGLHPAEWNAVRLALGPYYLRNSLTLHTVLRKWSSFGNLRELSAV